MSGERLERIRELHALALEKSPTEREAFLDEACGGDEELRAEVESLLRARDGLGDFLERPATERLGVLLTERKAFEAGERVGRYEIVRVLGRGGTGTVYEALQEHPTRRVALKVMHADLGTGAARGRFEEEAEILARLQHPGIAHVYEAGVHASGSVSLPFFALEYLEGARTVVAYAEAEGLSVRDRLALTARICDAVHHGHQKGVIHRDLKPGNVLVDASGRPKIIDFGIARAAGTDVTADGELVGTLSYMSPERLRRDDEGSDVRSDVYALGVLLYELLSGRLPHGNGDEPLPETARRIREDEPAPLSHRDRRLRGEIEDIVGKAIDREREQRYASAAALAADLRRYLDHLPVEAHPPGLLYPLRKFARRRLGLFLALNAVVLVSIAAAVIGSWLAYAKEQQKREAEFQAYVAGIAGAAAALRNYDIAEARQCLERTPEHLRSWEWQHLSGRLDASLRTLVCPHSVTAGAVSDDGRVFAALAQAGHRNWLVMWEWSPGGVIRSSVPIRLHARSLALDPECSQLALGYRDGLIEIRNAESREVRLTLEGHEETVNAVIFDRDGRRLASGSSDGTIRVWRAADGAPLRVLSGHEDRVIGLDFGPRGRLLASGGREGAIRIWQVETGKLLRTLHGHVGSVEGVAFGPEGRRLASCSRDESMRIWDLGTGSQVAKGAGHTHNVRSVAFSPDGRVVATGSYDRTVRIWSSESASLIATLCGHIDLVRAVAFTRESGRLFSWGGEGAVKEWRVTEPGDLPTLTGHEDLVYDMAFAPDGRLLATASRDRTVRLWDPASHRQLGVLGPHPGSVRTVEFIPGGECLVTGSEHGGLCVWSIADGKLRFKDPGYHAYAAAVSPDGRCIFLGVSRESRVESRDAAKGTLLAHCDAGDSPVHALAIAPSGRTLASGDEDGTVRLHDAATLEILAATRVHVASICDLDHAPDGRRLVSASLDGTIRLLDARSLEELVTLEGPQSPVRTVAFSPDGTRIASGSEDGTVRLHDSVSGRQVLVLRAHRHPVRCVAFSPDGRCLASGAGGWEIPGAVRLWEIPE